MARILFSYILPLLLPTAVYLAWLRLRPGGQGGVLPGRGDGPWPWLLAGGLVLALGTVATLAVVSGTRPGSSYVPAHVEDGRVVPGRWK